MEQRFLINIMNLMEASKRNYKLDEPRFQGWCDGFVILVDGIRMFKDMVQ